MKTTLCIITPKHNRWTLNMNVYFGMHGEIQMSHMTDDIETGA